MKKAAGWVHTLIERRLNRPYLQFICLLVLAVYLFVLVISFATSVRGRTIFGPYLGADFAAYYIAGKIYNTHSPERIYDAALHHRLYQEEFPDLPSDSQLPYVNAPFFVLPFTVLARLPYAWAYFLWIILSLALYGWGFSLIWRTLEGIPRDAWLISFLLSLSSMPFLVECLAGGQTSAFGFFCFAVAISKERRGHHFLCGLAISLCTYKPTLLLLAVPMLVITRRYKTLSRFRRRLWNSRSRFASTGGSKRLPWVYQYALVLYRYFDECSNGFALLEICGRQLLFPAAAGPVSTSQVGDDRRDLYFCAAVSLSMVVGERFETARRAGPCLGNDAYLDPGP